MFATIAIAMLGLLPPIFQDDDGGVLKIDPVAKVVFVREKPILPGVFKPKTQFANCFTCFDRYEAEKRSGHISLTSKMGRGNTTIHFDDTSEILDCPEVALMSLAFENDYRRELLGVAGVTRFSAGAKILLKVKVLGERGDGSFLIEVLPSFREGNRFAYASHPEIWSLDGNTLQWTAPASSWSRGMF